MKNYPINLFTLVFFLFMSLLVQSQDKTVLPTTDEFDFLIGKEYKEVSELGNFRLSTRTSSIHNKLEMSSTCLLIGDYQIFTSEIVETNKKSKRKSRKIKDVIVLRGNYSACEGCLLSDQQNSLIKSIHSLNQIQKETVLVAFKRDNKNGKYTQVTDFGAYQWNTKTDRLSHFKPTNR